MHLESALSLLCFALLCSSGAFAQNTADREDPYHYTPPEESNIDSKYKATLEEPQVVAPVRGPGPR
jgi:hypothetical protein